jgi:hypothetical protein
MAQVGTWIVAGSAALALLTAFLLRTRLPVQVVTVVLAVTGAGLGWGGMLLRPDASVGEIVAAVVLLAVLVPAHVRIVLGRFGPRGSAEGTPAAAMEGPDRPGR